MAEQAVALTAATALSDEEVVKRVLAGETALYEVLMRRYNTRLYHVARGILQNDTEAEDVMQDAYVRAFQHLRQFAGRSKFSTWLTRIAVHEALGRAQKTKRFEEWDDMAENRQDSISAAQPQSNPESETASSELSQILERAIEMLPASYRTIVMLRDVEEMSTSDVAECLSLTQENVKIRLHRAHGMLRKKLYAKARISTTHSFPFPATRCDRVVSAVFVRIGALTPSGTAPGVTWM